MGLTRPRAYQIYDIDYKQAVRVVTISNITLSGGAPLQVDSVSLSLNDRVLVTGQSTGSQNGLYYVTSVGTGSNGTWARSIDGNETGEIEAGMIVMVTEGTTYADTQWKLTTNNPIVIGTTGLVFEQITGSGGSPGGANTYIQFNDNGLFNGTAGLTFDKTTNAVATTGSFTATGNITGGNVVGTLNGSGANVTSISATNISSGTLAQARLANSSIIIGNTTSTLGATVTTITGLTSVTSTTFVGALTGAATSATTAGTVTTSAQPNITSVGTLSSLSVSGAITGGSLSVSTGNITGGNIVNAGANGTGNIGSVGGYFNTVFAKATSAQYADLAEMYVADADYPPGTVVEFGGDFEITVSSTSHSTAVAGIISTNPSYLMNSTQIGNYVLPVALTGRVPCRVMGPVKKGDVLVASSMSGVAQRIGVNWQPGCVVGKSMENISDSSVQTIEVAVGRL